MPLVRISLRAGRSAAEKQAISDGIHSAMVETIDVPPDDRFQIVTEHAAGEGLIADPHYLGIDRTDGVVMIQIALRRGRTVEQKRALYRRIADNLAAAPARVRPQDVFVTLVENDLADWSFGNGEAQYVR